MASNFILPFAQGGGALVQSTPTYTADAQRAIGHQPGVARPDFANKALRQASAMAVGLAQFLADNQAADITDDLLAAAFSTIIANAVKAAAQSPAGTIVWVPATVTLPNTVKVNGSLLSRATYAKLWTFAQASGNLAASDGAWLSGQFSPGDGTTTFRTPDLRGYILRAFDDGRGVDAGRAIGTVQLEQLLSHVHGVTDPTHAHTAIVSDPGHAHTFPAGPPQGGAIVNHDTTGADLTITTSGNATGVTVGIVAAATSISIQATGGSELRMKNIALMPVMYF